MSITREDLVNKLSIRTDYKKEVLQDFITSFFDEIAYNLIDGKDVKLQGFGSFKVVSTKEKLGRNPKTKEEVLIPSRANVIFKPSSLLSKKIVKPKIKFK
ncbi:MAG: HU family DNA-binding protein [Psittacicella sp.]